MDYHGLKLVWSWMIDIDTHNHHAAYLQARLKVRL